MFKQMKKQVAVVAAAGTALAVSAQLHAAGWDYSTLTDGVDFSTIATGVLAVAAMLAAVCRHQSGVVLGSYALMQTVVGQQHGAA